MVWRRKALQTQGGRQWFRSKRGLEESCGTVIKNNRNMMNEMLRGAG